MGQDGALAIAFPKEGHSSGLRDKHSVGRRSSQACCYTEGERDEDISFSLIIKEESFNQEKKHHMMHLRALYKPQ